MIGGRDWKDHNENLKMLLQPIEDHNLTLRREKCEFGKHTLNFHGHLFTADGHKPSPDKIKAVQACTPPKTKVELVSFLQMLAYYVSRTPTDTESRYSQIERETLAVEFATSSIQMYLLGGKRFQLATDHKPLLPLFNNPQARLPPRIEQLIMKMQNLDFTMIHIPGKENVTDYMSRHPLPETTRTGVEKHVKAVIRTDHAIVLERIAAETAKDTEL